MSTTTKVSCAIAIAFLFLANTASSFLIIWALNVLGFSIPYSFQSFLAVWIILVVLYGLVRSKK